MMVKNPEREVRKTTLEVSTRRNSKNASPLSLLSSAATSSSTLRKRLTTHSPAKHSSKVYPTDGVESSDVEYETCIGRRRQQPKTNEERSQLICFRDADAKIVTAVRSANYNTFESKLVKYKSLDMPVKYLDPNSKVSLSAEDFSANSGFRLTKFGQRKHDIIHDTVDAWARRSGKNVFSNIRNSIFSRSNSADKGVVYKPLVFGGTYPIDVPTSEIDPKEKRSSLSAGPSPKFREYGPPKTFDIDRPI